MNKVSTSVNNILICGSGGRQPLRETVSLSFNREAGGAPVAPHTWSTLGLTLGKVFHQETIGDPSGMLLEVVGDQPHTNGSESLPVSTVSIEESQIESGWPFSHILQELVYG